MESRSHALMMAGKLKEITDKLGIGFVFKTSFDKANRTSKDSFGGIEPDEAVYTFEKSIEKLDIPCITDIHEPQQCGPVSGYVSALQIPALLSRQTDLIVAAGKTSLPINIKKGQFMAPEDMQNVIEKVGHDQILLTERGSSFGYHNLVVDMRSLAVMSATGFPVIFDATHSVQAPSGLATKSGGDRAMAHVLAKAAVATGIAGVFIETHQDPDNAPSDGPCMIKLSDMPKLIETLMKIDRVVKSCHG